MKNFVIKKVAVLGAGVMGAQIAAHCINARVPVVLFDLPDAKSADKNGIVRRGIDGLKKLSPAPLGRADDARHIEAGNYEEHHGHARIDAMGGDLRPHDARAQHRHFLDHEIFHCLFPGTEFLLNTA